MKKIWRTLAEDGACLDEATYAVKDCRFQKMPQPDVWAEARFGGRRFLET
jgi:hypothetical protein